MFAFLRHRVWMIGNSRKSHHKWKQTPDSEKAGVKMSEAKSRNQLSRREVLKLGAGALAAACMGGTIARAKQRPNILLLMSDQHRGDCLGADGNRIIHTPNLDRIANEGVRFRCGYSCTPTCTPARAALLTGLAPWRNGLLGYGRVGEKYPIEMPQALRDAGYYTMGVGKMHWHPQRNPHGFHKMLLDEQDMRDPGFVSDYHQWFAREAPGLDPNATGLDWNGFAAKAYALPERLHPTRWTADNAIEFLKSYSGPEPFFLKVSFVRPHSPYDPPERWMKKYAEADLPKTKAGKWAAKYAPVMKDNPAAWHGDLGPEPVRSSRQGYYGSVSFVDEQVGRILEALEQRGWLDETLILFTSDHGDMTGDQNLWRKSYPYEPSARIPFLMRWPTGLVSAKRGQVSMAPVELRDVLPTFLDAAGAPGAEKLDGRSLLSLVRGGGADWRKYVDLEHSTCYTPSNQWTALTDGHSKYIFFAYDGEEQFFDLDRDPAELNDLSSDPAYQDRVREWRRRMVNHLAERGAHFVKDGKPAIRRENDLYSPNYPGCSCHPMAKGEKNTKPKSPAPRKGKAKKAVA